MQDPIDNCTEWLVAAPVLSGNTIKVWKYYQNDTKAPFTDSFELKSPNFQFQQFKALHVKDNGLLVLMVGTDGKSMKMIYKDSLDDNPAYQA